MLPSNRLQAVQTPMIPIVGELIRNSPGTISLGQGVVSYPPPLQAIAQITQFLAQTTNHQYHPVQGIPALQEAIATKLLAENGISIGAEHCVVVTAGSNMGFLNAVLAIADPGDEIILQTPYYFNHEMATVMANCRPVLVNTNKNYQLNPDAIRQAITPKTKAVVTVSPNNPTGVVYPKAVLQEVNEICRERGIYHITDETYEYFTYDGASHFSVGSTFGNHTISLFSLSKAYGFASWRIGYMVIPAHLMSAVIKIQDTNLICAAGISQYAALGALQAGKQFCLDKVEAIAQVRQIVLQELATIPHLCTIPPTQGAFYFLLKVHTDLDSLELIKQLIHHHKVAALPGSTFGMEGCYLRVAYGALDQKTAAAGIDRLVQGLQEIIKKRR
ncbi:MAG: pyridoxal phosphate-dependent aminotransferase [Timaviella obliquedivisa GSE-PSE-MK23-08B]|nr:pyridoxal phosphate-dependent aminotransferase [Timaviella obliquedivisa GSE-PSE-MK23-08B]